MTQPSQPGLFARRIGPFPVWLLLLLLVLIVGFIWWRRRNAASGDASNSVLASTNGGLVGGGLYTNPQPSWYQITGPSMPGGRTNGYSPRFPGSGSGRQRLPGEELDPISDNTPDAPPATTSTTYAVKSGDTLTSIAQRFGVPRWEDLYWANQGVIESTAKAHGYKDGSGWGHWIFPETVLVIPQ